MTKERCSKRIFDSQSYQGHLCQRSAVNTEDGKPWCKQHTPSLVKAKNDEQAKKWREEWDQQRANDEARRKQIEDEKNELTTLRAMKKAAELWSKIPIHLRDGSVAAFEILACRGPDGRSIK